MREDELYARWQAGTLTPEEKAEALKLLGVGAEWSSLDRDRYIRGSDDPWYAANHWDNYIVPALEVQREQD